MIFANIYGDYIGVTN